MREPLDPIQERYLRILGLSAAVFTNPAAGDMPDGGNPDAAAKGRGPCPGNHNGANTAWPLSNYHQPLNEKLSQNLPKEARNVSVVTDKSFVDTAIGLRSITQKRF